MYEKNILLSKGMDASRRGKLMCIKVRMLDDTVGVFHLGVSDLSLYFFKTFLQHKAIGQALFDEVCRHLNLLECDYFGLEFLDAYGNHVRTLSDQRESFYCPFQCWLDRDKPILRQITAAASDARFYFVVKFYCPDPTDLEEEYTRYLYALQVSQCHLWVLAR